MICVCEVCADEFTKTRRQSGRWCSRRCAWQARGGPAHNARVSRETAAQRGTQLRDRGDGRSYRKFRGRHEHRLVAELVVVGRPLAPDEVVHHIDGDPRNNAPSNLAVMTRAQHIRLHAPETYRRAA